MAVYKFRISFEDYDDITREIEVKSNQPLSSGITEELMNLDDIINIKQLAPVLPVLSRKDLAVPFITCDEMLTYNEGKNLSLWELAIHYESARGNISHEEVFACNHDGGDGIGRTGPDIP